MKNALKTYGSLVNEHVREKVCNKIRDSIDEPIIYFICKFVSLEILDSVKVINPIEVLLYS